EEEEEGEGGGEGDNSRRHPEKIPFRLTRMLLNALEVSGVEGNYRYTCELVMRLLRGNKDAVMAMLEAFVFDPLITWRLLPPGHAGRVQVGGPPGAGQPISAHCGGRAPLAPADARRDQLPVHEHPVPDGPARRAPAATGGGGGSPPGALGRRRQAAFTTTSCWTRPTAPSGTRTSRRCGAARRGSGSSRSSAQRAPWPTPRRCPPPRAASSAACTPSSTARTSAPRSWTWRRRWSGCCRRRRRTRTSASATWGGAHSGDAGAAHHPRPEEPGSLSEQEKAQGAEEQARGAEARRRGPRGPPGGATGPREEA
ncbi:unnamed protein product, partial [Prorocentrum cordatum]